MAQDIYKESFLIELPNMIVNIHVPDISEEEQAIRVKRIHDACVNLLRKD